MTTNAAGKETLDVVMDALPLWGARPTAEVTLISLSENAVYRVDRSGLGRPFVVRVHRGGYNTEPEIESELVWLEALSQDTAIKLPVPIPGRDGAFRQSLANGQSAVAFEFIEGRTPTSEGDTLGLCEELGTLTAQLHRHARGWEPPFGFTRKTWDFRHCLGDQAIWGDWRAAPGLTPDEIEFLEPAVDRIQGRLEDFGDGPNRFGLVHGDMKVDHLIVGSDGLYLIDFDDCGFCWFLYDYGCAMTELDAGREADALTRAWMSGYRRAGALSWEEEDMLPSFSLLRRFMTMAWIGSRRDSPVATDDFGARYSRETLAVAERYMRAD